MLWLSCTAVVPSTVVLSLYDCGTALTLWFAAVLFLFRSSLVLRYAVENPLYTCGSPVPLSQKPEQQCKEMGVMVVLSTALLGCDSESDC